MVKEKTILAVVADKQGEVFEHPGLLLAGMNGSEAVRPKSEEMIPMPEGSRLFTIPQTPPIGFDRRSGKLLTTDRLPQQWGGGAVQAVQDLAMHRRIVDRHQGLDPMFEVAPHGVSRADQKLFLANL